MSKDDKVDRPPANWVVPKALITEWVNSGAVRRKREIDVSTLHLILIIWRGMGGGYLQVVGTRVMAAAGQGGATAEGKPATASKSERVLPAIRRPSSLELTWLADSRSVASLMSPISQR